MYKNLKCIEATKDWIKTNCKFAFIKIEDEDMDMCSLVETLLIAFLRKEENHYSIVDSAI